MYGVIFLKNLIIIAAIGENNELGLNNELIWHLPSDLKFFKDKTMNKNIIMGYKTYKSLPKLLNGRNHIVLTHRNIENEDIKVVNSIDELMDYIELIDDDIFVIGGASIYELLLPYCNMMFLTHIEQKSEADVFFPKINNDEWERNLINTSCDNNIQYKQYEYKRIKQTKKE